MLVAERFLLTPNCSACHGSVISASFHLCFLDCCCVFVCFSLLCSHVSSPAWSSPLTCLASVQSVQLSSVTPPAQHLLVSTVCIYVQSLVQSLSICCVCVIHWSPCSCFHKALELLGKQQNSKKKKKPFSNLQRSLHTHLRWFYPLVIQICWRSEHFLSALQSLHFFIVSGHPSQRLLT